jgi:hypothetical protein
MKKKGLLVLGLLMSIVCQSWALDWPENFFAFGLGYDSGDFRYFTAVWKYNHSLTIFRRLNKQEYYQKLTINDLKLQKDGFYELETYGSKLVTLFGAHYFFFHDVTHPEYSMFNVNIDYNKFYKEQEILFSYDNYMIGKRLRNIRSIIVPDVLEEIGRNGKIRYDTYDMERYYARGSDGIVIANPYGKPWATSKEPIGMTIDIEFNEVRSLEDGVIIKGGSNYLIILNGYVNPLKRHLYKENRRIKTLKIESLDNKNYFSIVHTLEDVVRFQVIKFPKATQEIRLTILDYYEGTKYKDLCVQAFLTDFDMWLESGDYYLEGAKEWRP